MTLLSRVFGLIRDVTLATVFGVSGGTDAFLVAFKIPNFMRRLFAEGAFSQAFVPVFSEYKEKQSREALRDLVNHVAENHYKECSQREFPPVEHPADHAIYFDKLDPGPNSDEYSPNEPSFVLDSPELEGDCHPIIRTGPKYRHMDLL